MIGLTRKSQPRGQDPYPQQSPREAIEAALGQADAGAYPPPPAAPARPRFQAAPVPVMRQPVPLDDIALDTFSAAAAARPLPSPLWCAGCGTDFTDSTVGMYDRMLLVLHRKAAEAGWRRGACGMLYCPACLPPSRLPVLAGGLTAEIELSVSALTRSGAYEDLPAGWERYDRLEKRRRDAEDAAAETVTIRVITERRAAA